MVPTEHDRAGQYDRWAAPVLSALSQPIYLVAWRLVTAAVIKHGNGGLRSASAGDSTQIWVQF